MLCIMNKLISILQMTRKVLNQDILIQQLAPKMAGNITSQLITCHAFVAKHMTTVALICHIIMRS